MADAKNGKAPEDIKDPSDKSNVKVVADSGPAGTAAKPVTETDVAQGYAPNKIGGTGAPFGEAPKLAEVPTPPALVEDQPSAPAGGFKTGDGATSDRPPVPEEQQEKPVPVQLKHYTHSRQRLTAEKLETMSKPEMLAVASDRGYDMRPGGRGSIVRQILDQQDRFSRDGDLHEPGELEEAPVVRDPHGTHGGSEEEINARLAPSALEQ